MTIRSTIIILTLAFSTVNCSPPNRENIDYVVYGTYAGECMNHCTLMFKLEKDKLLVDTTDSFFDNSQQTERVIFKGDTLSHEDFLKAQKVEERLPKLLLNSQSKDFGNPDQHDQGGIYIQFKSNNELKTFYIDTELDKIPGELRDYAKLIMSEVSAKWNYYYR